MRPASRRTQSGLAVLAMSLMLLLAMTLVALFAHRTMLFEQRSAAAEVRATQAFELAEAGLEWGIARLNDPRLLADAPSCEPGSNLGTVMSERALPWSASCTQDAPGRAATCVCGAGAGALGQTDAPGFILHVEAHPGGADSVEMVARGCTRLSSCDPRAAGFALQANAQTRRVVERMPLFRRTPASSVVAAAEVTLGDGVSITNLDPSTRGRTVMAGGTLAQAETARLVGLPGTPPPMSMHEHDPMLASWARADRALFFKAFFGVDPADYRADPLTRVVGAADCGAPQDCGSLIAREAAAGFRQFWVEPTLSVDANMLADGGLLGSATRPVVLVVEGDVALGAGVVTHGVWFSVGPSLRFQGPGAAVDGAVVAHGPVEFGGAALHIRFAPVAPRGRHTKVPGSWRDFAPFTDREAGPP